MKTILIACAAGVATSTIAVHKITNLCQLHNIENRIIQCSYSEMGIYKNTADVIFTTQKMDIDTEKPVFLSFPFLTGIGEAELLENVLKALQA